MHVHQAGRQGFPTGTIPAIESSRDPVLLRFTLVLSKGLSPLALLGLLQEGLVCLSD